VQKKHAERLAFKCKRKQLATRQMESEMLERWIIKIKRDQQRRTRRTKQKKTNKNKEDV
jgi:hypothetical protein